MTTKTDAIARAIFDAQFINCATEAEVRINVATRSKIAHQVAVEMRRTERRWSFDSTAFLAACGVA